MSPGLEAALADKLVELLREALADVEARVRELEQNELADLLDDD